MTQSVKEQFEFEMNRLAKEKTEAEQALLSREDRVGTGKLKLTSEAVKLRRTAQIMGRPIPAFNEREANPKVRDLQDQMKENVDQWNRERERFVAQIQKLEEGRRQWDTERRQLADHAGQLQQELVAGSGKDPEPEFACKPNPASAEVEELKLNLKTCSEE